MELKRVDEEVSKRYAKKDEISRKEVKKFTPIKWITASATGLVTLLYNTPKNSIHQIGIVFGCISIAGGESQEYTRLWHITNSIMDTFYYASWAFGVAFVLLLGYHMINRKKIDEDNKIKSVKNLKILATILAICIIITVLLVFILKLDLDVFHTKNQGVVTKNLTDGIKEFPMN